MPRLVASVKRELKPHDLVFTDGSDIATYYFLREGVPMGYLYGNLYGVENPPEVRRAFIFEGFGEEHTLNRSGAGASDIENARLLREIGEGDARIFISDRGSR